MEACQNYCLGVRQARNPSGPARVTQRVSAEAAHTATHRIDRIRWTLSHQTANPGSTNVFKSAAHKKEKDEKETYVENTKVIDRKPFRIELLRN